MENPCSTHSETISTEAIFSVIEANSSLQREFHETVIYLKTLNEASVEDCLERLKTARDRFEKVGCICKVLEIVKKITLRYVQIISVLKFLSEENNKGKIAQINTGEGKTNIIAIFAAYLALEGRNVDIGK
jgi:preprotein translocase subunit SecA